MLVEIKVGSFEWALVQLKRGERVRRSCWVPGLYCQLIKSDILDDSYIFTVFFEKSKKYGYTLNSEELTETDWELCK